MSQYEEERIICAQTKRKAKKIHIVGPESNSGAFSTLWHAAQSLYWAHQESLHIIVTALKVLFETIISYS